MGTAAARAGNTVRMYARDQEQADAINTTHRNPKVNSLTYHAVYLLSPCDWSCIYVYIYICWCSYICVIKALSEFELPENMTATTDLAVALQDVDVIILSLPAQILPVWLARHKVYF